MGPETHGFLKNCWYVAAWDHELIDGKLLARTILEKPVLLYRGDSGRVVALDNRCCHRGAKLSNGRREGDDVRCMYHGLKFDPSGKCIQIPGQDNIPPKLGVRSYPVRRARPPGLDLDGRAGAGRSGEDPRLPVPARSGLARQARLHALQGELPADRRQPERLRAPRVRAHQDARRLGGVRLQVQADRDRAARGRLPRRALAHGRRRSAVPQEGGSAGRDKVDRRNIARMYVPGIFFMETLFSPAGAGAREGQHRRARSSTATASSSRPETRRSTHFFWDYLHDYELRRPDHRAVAATRA